MADTTPPNLTSLSLPSLVDLSAGDKRATFSATATDDASGLQEVVIWFDKNLTTDIGTFPLEGLYGFSDSWADGASSDSRTISRFNASGAYNVEHVDVRDKAGNVHTYTPAQLAALGASTSMTLQGGTPDTTAPNLTSLSFPSFVDLSGGPKQVTFSATASDDASGVSQLLIWFDKSLNTDIGSFSLEGLYGSPDSWADGASSDTRTITTFNAPGSYNIDHVDLKDKVGNVHTYSPSQLAAIGAPTSITLQGGTADTTPPNLTSLSFPSVVDLSHGDKQVTFSATASDNASGIDEVVIWFDKNLTTDIGAFRLEGLFGLSDSWADGASSETRTVSRTNALGAYNIDHVDVRDKVGNVHSYDPAQLAALGAPTSMTLTLGPHAAVEVLSHGDFNADGKDDLLWRNSISGDVGIWLLNGTSVVGSAVVASAVPASWQTEGTGDFNGDGKADILWRNTVTGDVAEWLMNGLTPSATSVISAGVPLSWQTQGTGDFNGDHKDDILWRNTATGDVAEWLMNGLTPIGTSVVGNAPASWATEGTGDFNGDARADILWRNTATGDVAEWLMNGTAVASGGVVGSAPLSWQTHGTGDFNGDHNADILWRNTTTGDVAEWLMNGGSLAGAGIVGSALPLSWQTQGPGDFNGDGRDDILWLNTGPGDVAEWFLNGTTVVSGGVVFPAIAPDWLIVG